MQCFGVKTFRAKVCAMVAKIGKFKVRRVWGIVLAG